MARPSIAELFDLTGKGAVVTGGGKGIGEGIAYRLAEAGAGVMVTDIDIDAAKRTVEQICADGGRAEVVLADGGSVADAYRVAQRAVEAFGRLDILVNNASIYPYCPVMEITEEDWDQVMNLNLKGYFFYSKAAAEQMIKAKLGGKIINITSSASIKPDFMLGHYGASKGGELLLTKAMALELAPHGITVNAIGPGVHWTPGLEALLPSFYEPLGMTLEEYKPTFMWRLPLGGGEMGDADDVAKVALFLASGAADYMTGSFLLVDGGLLLT